MPIKFELSNSQNFACRVSGKIGTTFHFKTFEKHFQETQEGHVCAALLAIWYRWWIYPWYSSSPTQNVHGVVNFLAKIWITKINALFQINFPVQWCRFPYCVWKRSKNNPDEFPKRMQKTWSHSSFCAKFPRSSAWFPRQLRKCWKF